MATRKRPNIVLVFDDQHRFCDLGIAGNPDVQTPHLDRLASEGLYLPNTFSNVPVCCPARAVLLTGRYAHRAGLRINDQRISLSQPSLAGQLAAAGYQTAFVGKWHLDGGLREPGYVPPERRFGYQWWAANECNHDYFNTHYFRGDPTPVPMEAYEPISLTDAAIDFLRAQDQADRPFFLTVAYSPPHDPYTAPERYMQPYDPNELTLRSNFVPGTRMYNEVITRRAYQGYYAAITCVDEQIGRLMDELESMGQADDTLFVFTSDHGDMLGSHGYALKRKPYDESIRVPGIVRWPAAIPPGGSTDALVTWVDLMPTLLSMAGAEIPEGVQGADLSDLLLDAGREGPESAYLQIFMGYPTGVHGGWRGVRTARYTYARYEDRPWVLFDNREDPYQMRNLVTESSATGLCDDLEDLVRQWMRETEDTWAYNVPKTIPLHHDPVERHEAMIAAAYQEAGRPMPS